VWAQPTGKVSWPPRAWTGGAPRARLHLSTCIACTPPRTWGGRPVTCRGPLLRQSSGFRRPAWNNGIDGRDVRCERKMIIALVVLVLAITHMFCVPALDHRSPGLTACSLGLSATSQQYFSLRTNQPPATSRNQPAVLFSQNKPAPVISHQPTEQAVNVQGLIILSRGVSL
jgi:hypothetical protein